MIYNGPKRKVLKDKELDYIENNLVMESMGIAFT